MRYDQGRDLLGPVLLRSLICPRSAVSRIPGGDASRGVLQQRGFCAAADDGPAIERSVRAPPAMSGPPAPAEAHTAARTAEITEERANRDAAQARENELNFCGAEDCLSPEPGTPWHDAEGEFRRRRQGARGNLLRGRRARHRGRSRARDHEGPTRARTRRSGSGRAADGPSAATDRTPPLPDPLHRLAREREGSGHRPRSRIS